MFTERRTERLQSQKIATNSPNGCLWSAGCNEDRRWRAVAVKEVPQTCLSNRVSPIDREVEPNEPFCLSRDKRRRCEDSQTVFVVADCVSRVSQIVLLLHGPVAPTIRKDVAIPSVRVSGQGAPAHLPGSLIYSYACAYFNPDITAHALALQGGSTQFIQGVQYQ